MQKTEFIIDTDFDNLLMVEIFAGKFVAFRDMTTLMIDAARVGRSDMIQSILDDNPDIDINAKNFKGESALISAAKSGNLEALKILIKNDGSCLEYTICDNKGNTALHHAAKHGHLDILELLFSKFVSIIT